MPPEVTRRAVAPSQQPGEHGPPPQSVLDELSLLWSHRSLLYTLVVTDLRHRYVGSSIGFFWTVVNPILELVTYTFVFRRYLSTNLAVGEGDLDVISFCIAYLEYHCSVISMCLGPLVIDVSPHTDIAKLITEIVQESRSVLCGMVYLQECVGQ